MTQTVSSLDNTTAGSVIIPDGCYLVSVIQKETTGNKVTGGIKYGSTSGGDDIVFSMNMDANETERLLITDYKAPSTVYFDAVEDWAGATVDIHIVVDSLT